MSSPLLYSCNVWLKFHIQEKYRGGVHYVWCSEIFDAKKANSLSSTSLIGATSNPADIYRDLKQSVTTPDGHNPKIIAQRASFIKLARKWEKDGSLSKQDLQDIQYQVKLDHSTLWRPLIYVIPRVLVEVRMVKVTAKDRAGFGDEYIIPDLKTAEFDIIEP